MSLYNIAACLPALTIFAASAGLLIFIGFMTYFIYALILFFSAFVPAIRQIRAATIASNAAV